MKTLRAWAAVVAVSAVLALSACGVTPAVEPITVSANDLQGETVEVPLNAVLNINTGDLPADSYTAEIADGSIAEFLQGREGGDAIYNPGFKPLKVGETDVTMTNEQGGIEPLQFTIKVVPVPAGSNLGGSGR
ncbi:MAG: hypothetical protein JWP85_1308 [Rhodoglobus sp.]|nr:hypothetical protein [Rhodoglobus sp.]